MRLLIKAKGGSCKRLATFGLNNTNSVVGFYLKKMVTWIEIVLEDTVSPSVFKISKLSPTVPKIRKINHSCFYCCEN